MRLGSDGADYAGQTSKCSHRVVISSPREKEEAHHSNINPLGRTRQTIRSTTVCSHPVVFRSSERRVFSTSNTSAFNAKGTNLWNKGLISADRRTRPTLTLTIPSSLVKSSTKDLSFPTVVIVIQRTRPAPLVRRGRVSQSYDVRPRAILTRFAPGKVNIVAFPAWILT